LAQDVLQRELEYHEKLYSGFAQQHFAKPAVRALREHLVKRILRVTGAGPRTRVLSLGCGIGDTELILAPHVREVVGIDLSPSAVRQARADAQRARIGNAHFIAGSVEQAKPGFDIVIAIFFLHHVSDEALACMPGALARILARGGMFYSLDPSLHRLSGMVGRVLFPGLMKRYQTEDERELEPGPTLDLFRRTGFEARLGRYDFLSSPLAGLFPAWRSGYRAARLLDELLVRTPLVARLGSNFEILARWSPRRR
jgi:SAM-dependent methyltransferase